MTFWLGLIRGRAYLGGAYFKVWHFPLRFRNLFVFEDQGAIEVAKADGSSRSVLVHAKVVEQRAVTVHPLRR